MNKSNVLIALLILGLSIGVVPATADGYLSKLNPFNWGSSSAKPKPRTATKKTAAKSDSSWFKMPKLPGLGGSTAQTKKQPKKVSEPSMLSKMGTGTKKLFTDPKGALFPSSTAKKPSRDFSADRIAGNSTGTRQKKAAEPSLINPVSWFKPADPEPEPDRPKVVSDWISGPRPD